MAAMLDLENSALGVRGETTVSVDVWATGDVTLQIETHVATVRMVLGSIADFLELDTFIRSVVSAEPREYTVAAIGMTAVCCREDTRVIFSLFGDSGPERLGHMISLHIYGPRLIEFLDCLSDVHDELATQ